MLRKLRILTTFLCLTLLTLLFCDFTGIISVRFAPLAKIQFLPALLAGSVTRAKVCERRPCPMVS